MFSPGCVCVPAMPISGCGREEGVGAISRTPGQALPLSSKSFSKAEAEPRALLSCIAGGSGPEENRLSRVFWGRVQHFTLPPALELQ